MGNNLVGYWWEASSYHCVVFALPVCIVDWPDILSRILASLKEKLTCTKMFFVAYTAAGCKARLIFHATSNFSDISC